jgi:4-hydroxythreonine-4-phosphate dehydrogenase
VAITTGEPAGIGPEVSLRAALNTAVCCDLIGDAAWLEQTARRLQLPWPLPGVLTGQIGIHHVPLQVGVRPGVTNADNARYVIATLDEALAGWREGRYAALATAPVHKAVINQAGIPFTGHTEYLADRTAAAREVMMLVGGGLRVALASTHLPLRAVPDAITRPLLDAVLDVLHHDLVHRFGLANPRIAVLGLNPHAGEGGYLGREEIDVIQPAVVAAQARGIAASGPWPADTAFVPRHAQHMDVILAMYHDQGLATLKYASFGGGVNVTLGMPLIRTSADHGTALDLSERGGADPGSMMAAVQLAEQLAITTQQPH